MNKVFGIGFHKTATTTLASVLEILGYKVTGPNKYLLQDIKNGSYKRIRKVIAENDAFQDNPWPIIYQYLDKEYPESKFILTIRDSEKWIQSTVNHFGTKPKEMRKWIYGDEYGFPEGNEQVYLDRYNRHNEEVITYFKDRPDDLLVWDITKNRNWEPICKFLQHEIPSEPFPHENKRSYSKLGKILRKMGIH